MKLGTYKKIYMNGIVYKFGNDINTDVIISGRYKFSITDPNQLAKHIF